MKVDYLMRSLMFVPAHNERLMESASRTNADVLLLDIEDSVQPEINKQLARDTILKYLKSGKFKNKKIFPRVNDRESGHLLQDVYQLTVEGIEGFTYPKAKKGGDVYFFGKLLETIEAEKGIPIGTFKIIVLIETAAAIINIKEICNACTNRTVAVAFGCEDYMTDLQGKHDSEGQSIFTARSIIAMGARAADIITIDTVHIKVHDLVDLEKNLEVASNLGFEGMLSLNPKELPLIHKFFSPSTDEIEWANEIIRLSIKAEKEGIGVSVTGDKFVGPPMVKMAKEILNKSSLITQTEE